MVKVVGAAGCGERHQQQASLLATPPKKGSSSKSFEEIFKKALARAV